MKFVSALMGLVALGGVAFSASAASATPIARADDPSQVANMQRANYTCNGWGHCCIAGTRTTATAADTTTRITGVAAATADITGSSGEMRKGLRPLSFRPMQATNALLNDGHTTIGSR